MGLVCSSNSLDLTWLQAQNIASDNICTIANM